MFWYNDNVLLFALLLSNSTRLITGQCLNSMLKGHKTKSPKRHKKHMGFHTCEYLSYADAEQRGIKHLDRFHSSGDVTLNFASGNSWEMPDMAPLYVELGWVPPQAFINDVMYSTLTGGERLQTRGMSVKEEIGYLSPSTHPLPLVRDTSIPEVFSDKLAQLDSVVKL